MLRLHLATCVVNGAEASTLFGAFEAQRWETRCMALRCNAQSLNIRQLKRTATASCVESMLDRWRTPLAADRLQEEGQDM